MSSLVVATVVFCVFVVGVWELGAFGGIVVVSGGFGGLCAGVGSEGGACLVVRGGAWGLLSGCIFLFFCEEAFMLGCIFPV